MRPQNRHKPPASTKYGCFDGEILNFDKLCCLCGECRLSILVPWTGDVCASFPFVCEDCDVVDRGLVPVSYVLTSELKSDAGLKTILFVRLQQ